MDLLDLITVRTEEVLTGTYYKDFPETPQDIGIEFNYDVVDDSDRSYFKVLDTLQTVQAIQTIKTHDLDDIKVNSYIVTQDGKMWQIRGAVERVINEHNKQALRWQKRTAATEYVIRLVAIENPWGIK